MIKVGVVGCGFVDGVLNARQDENNRIAKIVLNDQLEEYIIQ